MTSQRLSNLGFRALTEHKGRAVLMAAGVTLGVALFTGALLTTASLSQAMDRRLGSDVTVSAVGDHLDRGVLDTARALPDVARALPLIRFGTSVTGPSGKATEQRINQGPPAVFVGFDVADINEHDIHVVKGQPFAGNDVVVTEHLADLLGVEVDDPVRVATPTGSTELRVVGIATASPDLGNDSAVVGTVALGQQLAGRPGAVNSIGLVLRGGTDVDRWIASHNADLGPTATLDRFAGPLGLIRAVVRQLASALVALGALMVLAGAYLVYLSIATRVVERVRLYGTLHALGATRRQIRRLVVTEAAALGGGASILGTVLGVGIASLMLGGLSRQLALFGGASLVVNPALLAVAAVGGALATVVAAYGPARRAANLDPVAAITETHTTDVGNPRYRALGAAITALGVILLAVGGGALVFALLALLIGVLILLPTFMAPLANIAQLVVGRLGSGLGIVAVHHVVTERRRSSRTLGLIVLMMSLLLAVGAFYVSATKSIDSVLARQFAADLQLRAAASFPPDVVQQIDHAAGVRAATAAAGLPVDVVRPDGVLKAGALVIDPSTYFDVTDFAWAHGDATTAQVALSKGDAILVPQAAATSLGMKPGSNVKLRTASGVRNFRVAATFKATTSTLSVVIARVDAERYFGFSDTQVVWVDVAQGANPDAVSTSLQSQFGERSPFIVYRLDDLRRDVRTQLLSGVAPFLVLFGLGAIIGLVGLANTLAVSVLERYREIGILRAIGARRRQIHALAMVESALLVLIALIVAIPLGWAISRPLLDILQQGVSFTSITYHFPWSYLIVLGVVGVVTAVGAGFWPARHAASLDIDRALRFE